MAKTFQMGDYPREPQQQGANVNSRRSAGRSQDAVLAAFRAAEVTAFWNEKPSGRRSQVQGYQETKQVQPS